MSRFDREKSEQSLVTVFHSGNNSGMGVLVLDRYILTAAHCLAKYPDAQDPGCDRIPVRFKTFAMRRRKDSLALVVGVDPCSDLAILADTTALGSILDGEDNNINSCLPSLRSARVSLSGFRVGTPVPVHFRSHKRNWISAKAIIYSAEDRFLNLMIDERCDPLRGGTSGSPVFDRMGCVIGLISSSGDTARNNRSATAVRLAAALPGWFTQQLRETR